MMLTHIFSIWLIIESKRWLKKVYTIKAMMATHKPDAVAIRASPTPPVIADAPAPASRILKEPIIPVTVPSRPNPLLRVVTLALPVI